MVCGAKRDLGAQTLHAGFVLRDLVVTLRFAAPKPVPAQQCAEEQHRRFYTGSCSKLDLLRFNPEPLGMASRFQVAVHLLYVLGAVRYLDDVVGAKVPRLPSPAAHTSSVSRSAVVQGR